MSWLTDALDQMNREIVYKSPNNIASAYACGMQRARTIIMANYVQHAEQNNPTYANYANPEDMK